MASASDYFKEVGLPGSATTLASPGFSIGNTTINVGSTANWPTTTGVTFAIDTGTVVVVNGQNTFVRTPGSYTEYSGVVSSGTAITGIVLEYGTAQNYPAGATTRVYIPVSSSRENKMVAGLRNVLNDNATLKAAAIPDNSISTTKVADGSVTSPKLNLTAQSASNSTTQNYADQTYTSITGAPAVTVTTGASGNALVIVTSYLQNDTASQYSYASFAVSGATTQAATDSKAVKYQSFAANSNDQRTGVFLASGLTPGSNTFTLQNRVSGNIGAVTFRSITVIPI